MKKIIFLFFITFSISTTYAQNDIWKKLGKLTYKKQYDELLGFKVDVPVFGADIKTLEGKEIIIKGYIIPTNGYKSQTEFVFSAFPYNMCFFCGGAGPETVMEVYAIEGVQYTTEPITLKGILNTNTGDINRLMYSLSKAKKVN